MDNHVLLPLIPFYNPLGFYGLLSCFDYFLPVLPLSGSFTCVEQSFRIPSPFQMRGIKRRMHKSLISENYKTITPFGCLPKKRESLSFLPGALRLTQLLPCTLCSQIHLHHQRLRIIGTIIQHFQIWLSGNKAEIEKIIRRHLCNHF